MAKRAIDEQVMVITGASSGIGRATALAAAARGARVVLAARSAGAIRDLADELGSPVALAVECDVADGADVQALAVAASGHFGRVDTWVNNAGVGIYGMADEVDLDDARTLFDTNFWGLVNGSLVALPLLRESGGTLINVGSEVSESYFPLQAYYAASKHAVKGFTDVLRVEQERVHDGAVSVVLVQPTAVDTPFPQHARNFMDAEPRLPSAPMVDPEQVARAILGAAEKPERAVKVGAGAHLSTAVAKAVPPLADRFAARQVGSQQYDEPPRDPQGALRRPSEATRGGVRAHGSGGRVAG